MTDKTVKEIAQNKLGLQSYIENLILEFEKAHGVTISGITYSPMELETINSNFEKIYRLHKINIEIKI